jgi:mono/diheme cytochrome c family protein
MAKSLTFSALLLGFAGAACAAEPVAALGIGRPASELEIVKADITVLPDGAGLPAGRGNAKQGAPVYHAKCAACHGDKGQGIGDFPALVGGLGSLASKTPLLTVGSYWPVATTVFDYIRRAMPYHAAGELTDDEVYALTAWVLAANGIIKQTDVLDCVRLPRVKMPNKDGFVTGHPETRATP